MSTSTVDQPSIPPPPTFADFKFAVIGQPPQLLKRMGATPPLDFKHSPTPMHMDLQYPSRAGTPRTIESVATSQPSLQQRLESTKNSLSDGHHFPMDVSEHPPERKPIIGLEQPTTNPFRNFDGSNSPLLKQTSTHSSLQFHETQTPQISSSNTHTTIAIPRSPLYAISSSSLQTGLAPGPLSSMRASETHQSLKPQVHLDMKLLHESALIAFEKAERGLKSAQETYDAAKATLTAITTRLAADGYQQHTSEMIVSGSRASLNRGDSADPVVTEVARYITRLQTGPVVQKRLIQLDDPTLITEQRAFGRRITELEQEADDVRLAWSSLSAQRCSITSSALGADEYLHSATPPPSLGTSAGSSPATQSASTKFVADPTIIVKNEDIMDDHRRHALGRNTSFHNLSSGKPHLIDSTSSHVSVDHEVCRRSPSALVSDSSSLIEDVESIKATSLIIPTGAQDTTTIADSINGHVKGATAPRSALRGSLHNSIELDDTVEDSNSADSNHTRSESNPISLGEDISNELEVVRELEREDSGPCSSSTSQDVSRYSSVDPTENFNDTVDEEVLQTKPTKPSPDIREDQDDDRSPSTTQGSTADSYGKIALPSSQGDHRSIDSINRNSLLQRLQPLHSTAPSSKILKPQPESVIGPPLSPPSVLGKRQHFDPPSPRLHPSVVIPFKRRHLANNERNDPPSLESRISEASAHTNETGQLNSQTSPTYRGGNIGHNKNSYVSRNNIPALERSMSPPSGPRASRQETLYSKHGSAGFSRPLSVDYRPPVESLGLDCYPNKIKSKGPRKKYAHDGLIPTSGPSGTGRGGMRQNRVSSSKKWESGSTTDNTSLRRPDVRTHLSRRHGNEQISLADRLRDP